MGTKIEPNLVSLLRSKNYDGIVTILCRDVEDLEKVEEILTDTSHSEALQKYQPLSVYNPGAPHNHQTEVFLDFMQSLGQDFPYPGIFLTLTELMEGIQTDNAILINHREGDFQGFGLKGPDTLCDLRIDKKVPNEEILEAERQRVRSEYEEEMKEMQEKYKSEQQSKAKIEAEMEEMKRQYEEKLQDVNDRAETATVTRENVVESEEVDKDNEQNEEQKAAMEKLRKLQASLLDGGKRAGDTDLKEKRGILLGNNTSGGSKAVKTPMLHSQEDTDIDLLLQAELNELTLAEKKEQKLKEIADIRKKKDQIHQNIERLSPEAQAGPNVWTRNWVLCLVAFVVLAVFAAKHPDTGRKRPVGGIDEPSQTDYPRTFTLSGEAALWRLLVGGNANSHYLGVYRTTGLEKNGKPVWKLETANHYFFYTGDGYWKFGPDYTWDWGWIRSEHDGSQIPATGWEYFANTGGWWEDSSLRVTY